jgi:hypothetical protein
MPPPEMARRFRDEVGRWGRGATVAMLAPSLVPGAGCTRSLKMSMKATLKMST